MQYLNRDVWSMLNQCTQRPACLHRVGHAACSVSLLQGSSVPLWPQETSSSFPIPPCDWLLLTNRLVWWKKLMKSWESGTERRNESRWWRWRRPQRVCGVSQLWHEWCQKLLLRSWTESLLKCYKFWRMLSCLLLWGCFLYFHAASFLKENIWIKQSKKYSA